MSERIYRPGDRVTVHGEVSHVWQKGILDVVVTDWGGARKEVGICSDQIATHEPKPIGDGDLVAWAGSDLRPWIVMAIRGHEAWIRYQNRDIVVALAALTPCEARHERSNDGLAVITWSHKLNRLTCSQHGPDYLYEKSAGFSRQQHMPLHVWKCRNCGAETEPAIHFDLGG